LRRYLLGQLDEARSDEVELALLSGGGMVAALETAEDDLIEDYLEGALPASDRLSFEQYFLASEAHAKSVEAARLLRDALRRRPQPSLPLWAKLAAGITLAAAAAFWASGRAQAPSETADAPAAVPAERREGSPAAPERRGIGTQPRFASLTLVPGQHMSASDSTPEAVLAPEVEVLKLELVVEDPEVGGCRVSIASTAGDELWSASGLRATPVEGGATVSVDVPVAPLRSAPSYVLTLVSEASGESSGRYYFKIRRR
jgi:hypothetical protein